MGEQDMESLLRNYLAAKGETPFIGIIHRLDQPVEGVIVFGKTREATAELNRQMQKNGFGKYYLTVVYGKAEPKEGQLTDFLYLMLQHIRKNKCVEQYHDRCRNDQVIDKRLLWSFYFLHDVPPCKYLG